MREQFEFQSKGERISGDLFLPPGKPIAALVLTGPLTSVKEQASGAHARALAERGFAALAFDHRYFGESGGQPRQFENPRAKVEDIRAAVAALRESPKTRSLPLAAVGVCAGAGYMAAAASGNANIRSLSWQQIELIKLSSADGIDTESCGHSRGRCGNLRRRRR